MTFHLLKYNSYNSKQQPTTYGQSCAGINNKRLPCKQTKTSWHENSWYCEAHKYQAQAKIERYRRLGHNSNSDNLQARLSELNSTGPTKYVISVLSKLLSFLSILFFQFYEEIHPKKRYFYET